MASRKPNILIIWGDEIGWFNLSVYNHGIMGYRTPHIDRIAKEGALFTDWYGQQSSVAARAAFITGQFPIRTGLTDVSLHREKPGLRAEDPTIAALLKPLGYVSGQFGGDQLGESDTFLPVAHGFDESFGGLTPGSSEDGGNSDFPNDDEITSRAIDFIERQASAGKPFFCWWNSNGMRRLTNGSRFSQPRTPQDDYPDSIVDHDDRVGRLLAKLDELGIRDNTIVMYSTSTGAEEWNWPNAGTTPFRGQKATNWEGGWRVPAAIRWPGVINPGTVLNDVFSHQDMLPTVLAAAGEPTIVEKCRNGHTAGEKTFRVQLDGFNLMPYLKGDAQASPRRSFLYWIDSGDLVALRHDKWKIHFAVQYAEGVEAWQEPLEQLTLPMLVDLRSDPFENAEVAADHTYEKWRAVYAAALEPVGAVLDQCIKTLKDFPPRQGQENLEPVDVVENLRRRQELLEAAMGERHVTAR